MQGVEQESVAELEAQTTLLVTVGTGAEVDEVERQNAAEEPETSR